MDDLVNKAVGTAGLAGGALMFSPIGFPFLFHGLSGALVGGFGFYAANVVIGKIVEENASIRAAEQEAGDHRPEEPSRE